ncbi:MAG: DUF3617 domain-containing protein [Syntrophaceae bacterium]|nr:DUF3617 domain-containing protein [Syntrophaceae bacterium]
MKGKDLLIILVLSIILVSFGTSWAGPRINPGKWEITTKTEMAGIPPQSITHVQCITDQDMVPVSQDASKECKVTDIIVKGDTAKWKISCGGQGGQMEGTGQVTYSGDTMKGTMQMMITEMNTKVTNYINGRRIGKCDGLETVSSSPNVQNTQSEASPAGEALQQDAKDVGQAARDEIKNSTIDEVRKGVRSAFEGLFH